MLKLSRNDGKPIATFETYYELYQYIRDLENAKLLEEHPEFGQTKWSFMLLSREEVAEFSGSSDERYDPKILSRALEEKSGLIEICEGDEKNLRLIVASPEVDIEGWRQEFCEDYCDAHNLVITESS